jgi:hypothetical protein
VADSFIEVPIESDPQTMADNAIDLLTDSWDGWEPNEGDLEVVTVEAVAQMAADAANVAAIMPAAAFEAIAERLFGVVPQTGAPATSTVTFTMLDTDPHTIAAGTEIDIDGFAFSVDDDTDVAALAKAGVPVTANENDTLANGLTGETVTMIGPLVFIASVSLDRPTGGAVDPETEDQYLDRTSQALELQALTLVTPRDYELLALSQATVGRATAVVDMALRKITVTVSADDGTVLTTTQKNALAALFDSYRQTTWQVLLGDPTKTTINVTFQVHVYAGFDSATTISNAVSLLVDFLNPATWGSTQTDLGTPVVEPRVRKNQLIDVIANAIGVQYVIDLTITGSAGSVQTNGDWLMPGTVPVPVAGTITGTAA